MTDTQRMVSADEAQIYAEMPYANQNIMPIRLARTVVELTAQLKAEEARADAEHQFALGVQAGFEYWRARADAAEAKVRAAFQATRNPVNVITNVRAALADPEAQS